MHYRAAQQNTTMVITVLNTWLNADITLFFYYYHVFLFCWQNDPQLCNNTIYHKICRNRNKCFNVIFPSLAFSHILSTGLIFGVLEPLLSWLLWKPSLFVALETKSTQWPRTSDKWLKSAKGRNLEKYTFNKSLTLHQNADLGTHYRNDIKFVIYWDLQRVTFKV